MGSEAAESASVRAVVAVLVGKPLSGTFRAVDMEMFEFGEQVPFVDRFGRDRTTGEFRLHVQSVWRIVRDGRIVVGYEDMPFPPTGVPADGFDANEAVRNRRDELMDAFLASTLAARTVVAADASELGDIRLEFADGSRLEVFPSGEHPEIEHWRLLTPDGSHSVMSGEGMQVMPPGETP